MRNHRLLLTLTGLLAAVGLWALAPSVMPSQQSSPPETATGPASTPERLATSAATPDPTPSPSAGQAPSPEDPAPKDSARSAAGQRSRVTKFATAYANPDLPRRRWLAGLQPHVTPMLLEGFRYTDQRLLPAGVLDRVQRLPAPHTYLITYTDRTIICTLERTHSDAGRGPSWLVVGVEPGKDQHRPAIAA